MLEGCLTARPQLGLWEFVLDQVLVPRNPFEPDKARPPKKEVAFFGLLLLLGVGCFAYFSLVA